ncbi:WhiB family transcriptional regulator [Streptomyces sp. SID3343]|uniref:WhiB family transcriptional regulator n=1 Tax=Streptomyces sp. SID3343 TaxID=2690260 RepID=UPI00136E22AD|nr:WhiB family transcriptional regulator [Streptomyces sp. SID3343]MYV97624.1 WhiB family transcriptional regulator [Streptomyces sp. SID3343]
MQTMTFPKLGKISWRDRASCRRSDPELFFPRATDQRRIRQAKELCRLCPVRQACLDSALVCEDADGIRGGLTADERGPQHKAVADRRDLGRVKAVLNGLDTHLNKQERTVLTKVAGAWGITAARLAWILKCTEDTADFHLSEAAKHRSTDRALVRAVEEATTPGTAATGLGAAA